MPAPPDPAPEWKETLRWAAPLLWRTDRARCAWVLASVATLSLLSPLSVVLMAKIVAVLRRSADAAIAQTSTWIALAGAAALLGSLAASVRKYAQNRLSDRVSLRVRRDVLQRSARLDLAELEDREQQNELALLAGEPGGLLVKAVVESLNLSAAGVQMLGLIGIMFVIEPWHTLAVLAAAFPLVATGGLLSMARHRLRRRNAETQRWSNYYTRHLTSHQLAPAVRVLGLADWMIDQALGRVSSLQQAQRRIDRWELALRSATSLLAVGLLMLAIRSVAHQAAAGSLQIERFVAFWMAAWRLTREAGSLANSTAVASKAWLETDYLRRFLQRPVANHIRTSRSAPVLRGEIVLDRVSFAYVAGQAPALEDVSLRIAPGETLAIVGENGAGKTTLTKLIAGLYRPTAGQIFYDGVPGDEIDLDHLHRQMALVMQRPLRLEATAAENIALGDFPRLRHDSPDILELSRELGLDAMLRRLPAGYDTPLGRMFGEYDLSGGQWQKLAIARALARRPTIVVLDEPTSGLDVYAERELRQCMQRLAAGRTAIIVSHRFSTVATADRIAVLSQGRLVELGPHAQLLASGGIYAAMWQAQGTVAA